MINKSLKKKIYVVFLYQILINTGRYRASSPLHKYQKYKNSKKARSPGDEVGVGDNFTPFPGLRSPKSPG